MAAYYDEFENQYYNPDDNAKKPGDNENWKMIQKGFSKISSTQLETSEGLTLGKGTDYEESLTAAELKGIKSAIVPKFNIIRSSNFPEGTFTSKTLVTIPLYVSESDLLSIKHFISANLKQESYSTCFLTMSDYKSGGNPLYTWNIDVIPLFKMGNITSNVILPNQVITLTDLALGFYNKTDSDITISGMWAGAAIIANFTKGFEY